MRERRIYQPGAYQPGDSCFLSQAASNHVVAVLRLSVGAKLCLFHNDNHEYEAEIISASKKAVEVKILSASFVSRESTCKIHLVQGISKGDRMDFVIQKAVELGVASIQPLKTERSVVKLDKERAEKKQQLWTSIAISACEQSGRNIIPIIHPIIKFEDYLTKMHGKYSFVLSPTTDKSWRDYEFSKEDLSLIIGPEGGFSPKEMQLLEAAKCRPLSMGPRILRTETAALVAVSVLQARYGDL